MKNRKFVACIKSKGKIINLRYQPALIDPFSHMMDIGYDYMERQGHTQFLLFDGNGEKPYKDMSRKAIQAEAIKIMDEGEQEIYKVYDENDSEDAESIGYLAVDKGKRSKDIARAYLRKYLSYKYNETYALTVGGVRYNWATEDDIRRIAGRFNAWRLFRQL